MDENGVITSWNSGGEAVFGYTAAEVIGCPVSLFFTDEDQANGEAAGEMRRALRDGYSHDDRWHLRKDATRFWASGTMTPLYDDNHEFRGYLKVARDKTSEKLASERMLYLAHHDPLTTLPNYSLFHEELKVALDDARPTQSIVQVLLLDLDRFKDINDSHGHHVGDLLLKEVAKRLRENVRSSDLVARLGGDEFGIICSTREGETDTVALASKLVEALSQPFQLEDKEVQSGVSIGVSVYPQDSRDPTLMFKNADVAMYAAKAAGRSTFRRYSDDLNEDARRRRGIGDWLCEALQNDGLELYYQPQYGLAEGRLTGIEALLRWRHCPVSNVTVEEIITIAAEIGLAEVLSAWTLRTACSQAMSWRADGRDQFRMSVNVSSHQINATAFLQIIDDVLGTTGIPAASLELEITESMLMDNTGENFLLFKSLKKKGINLAVDDFGTGTSSLSSLRNFPVDTLKIDREFVRDLPHSDHDTAIASAIIGLAHSLNLKVAAEGIERPEQADLLRSLGCDYGQGYLFGEPQPAEQFPFPTR